MEESKLIREAQLALAAGDRARLLDITSEHLGLADSNADFAMLRALALITSDTKGAASYAAKAARLRPDDPTILTKAAGTLLHTGMHDDAAGLVRRATMLAPRDFALRSDLAYLQGAMADLQGRDDEAESRFREAVEGQPEHPVFMRRLAVFLASRGRVSEAHDFLDATLSRYPGDPTALRVKDELRNVFG